MLQRQHDRPACLLRAVAEIDDTRCMQAVICQPALRHMFVHRGRGLGAVGRPDVPSRVRPVKPPSAADEYLRWRQKLAERRPACLYRKRHITPDCVTRKPPRLAAYASEAKLPRLVIHPASAADASHPSHSSCNVSIAAIPEFSGRQKYRINMLSIHIATKLYK